MNQQDFNASTPMTSNPGRNPLPRRTTPGLTGRVCSWGIAVSIAALPLAAAGQTGALRNPILAPGAAWAFEGFRVTVPDDEGWYSLAKDAHYADLAKDLPGGLQVAAVVEARKVDGPVVNETELLSLLREEQTAVPDAASVKLLDYTAEPYAPKGVLCTRFSVKFDDRRGASVRTVLLVRGVGCVRPDQPDVIVTLRYAQRTALDDVVPELQKTVSSFLDSLRFLPSNSTVMQQARLAVRSETPGDAVGLLSPIAEEGDGAAALFLGNIYLYGRGIPHDFPAARKWLGLAAQEGHAEAMYNIGAIYDKGLGVPRDVAVAIKWFTLAADQRDGQAQLNIALLYLNGDGVPKDIGVAEEWLKRAAGNGSKRAQGILTAGKYKEQ
jgi:hypothetical protein